MENTNRKKGKLLLLMLIFLVPVIILMSMFFSGSSSKDKNTGNNNKNAFNDKLPAANLKENGKNKLEIYMQAQQDSEKLKDLEGKDPYAKNWFDPTPQNDAVTGNHSSANIPSTAVPKWSKEDNNEKKVNERIDKLMETLNNNSSNSISPYPSSYNPLTKNDDQIEKLEKMLSSLKTADTTGDPEMKQLETMLDKILDIQHPERLKERLQDKNENTTKDTLRYAVSNAQSSNHADFYSGDPSGSENAFWGLSSSITAGDDSQTFLAVIHENQKIQDDQTIKLRLLQNIFINNTAIPKGQFIYGKCKIANGRVNISVQDIGYNNRLFPVQLTVYDQTDGMEGINIQGSTGEEVSRNGIDQMIQQMQLNSMTSSVGVQAATSGIQTAKNLLSRKVKKITVNLKAGHVLILKPAHS